MFFKFYHLAVLKTKNIFQWFDVKRNKVHFHVSICEYPNVHQLFFKNWRGYFNNQSPQFILGQGNISDVLKTISLLTMEHTFILSLFFSILFFFIKPVMRQLPHRVQWRQPPVSITTLTRIHSLFSCKNLL